MENKPAIDLIKKFEGCKLSAYLCPAGVITIGYGHTKNVKKGDKITQERAEQLLRDDVAALRKIINELVTVSLTDNKNGALVSLAYNIGITALKNSTLLKKLNQGNYQGAANEFTKWDKATIKGKKVVLAGLTKRRKAELEMFNAG